MTREDVHGPELELEEPVVKNPVLQLRSRRGPLGSRFAVEGRLRDLVEERASAWRSGEARLERNGEDEAKVVVALSDHQLWALREVLDALQALIDSTRALLDAD